MHLIFIESQCVVSESLDSCKTLFVTCWENHITHDLLCCITEHLRMTSTEEHTVNSAPHEMTTG